MCRPHRVPDRLGHDRRYAMSTAKIRRELGWKPQIAFEKRGLTDLIDWYAEHRAWWLTLLLVGGMFAGAMAWWLILTAASNHFRDRFNDRAVIWMNRIAGLAIGAFGVLTMILSHWARR